ncbi:MAG: glutamate--tRNA ligase [Acidobacteria bacterium]|nr:glutamate--tRNA ligase [Acidobacteriota bacterium]
MTVRTRVAPSPTGDPHVGTAYMALFNYCFAKKHGGQFLLRIEDTDQARSTASAEAAILNSLHWLGLSWDEGPDVGGPHAPYRQSERGAIYRKYCAELLDRGHAFRCYCTAERLDQLRKAQQRSGMKPGYDGHCLNLSPAERQSLESATTPFVVRMKVPEQGLCVLNDLLRGRIEIDWRTVDMQVLLKADGLPTYHLANVVDDHLMEITHVIRGEEWISSAPKHQLLYEYFGWPMPALCHMPLLRNSDKSKLSKRKNPTGIFYYQRMGYLPEALLNYLGLMAWSMPAGAAGAAEEKFTLTEMVEQFDLSRVSLGGPVFDIKKLTWLNGRWLRENLTDEQFADRVQEWALNRDYLMPIVPLVKSRVSVLSELGPLTSFFLSGELDLKPENLIDPKVPLEILRQALGDVLEKIEEFAEWKKEALGELFKELSEKYQIKLRDFLRPFYVAIAGSTTSTPLFDSMEILGRDLCRARLRRALELLSAGGR